MDAPSRGSCTPKIPRTLANGELTMYSVLVGLRTHILPQASGLRSVWALLFRFDLRYCRRIRECHALYLHKRGGDDALDNVITT